MNNIPRTARGVTWWAFDRFIWVKRSSYHIYIGYRNLKGSHGNLSKYKFGLAEYITVYVIQLQQLLQLLLRIITQYAKYVYFKFYKMFTECFWVISVFMSSFSETADTENTASSTRFSMYVCSKWNRTSVSFINRDAEHAGFIFK